MFTFALYVLFCALICVLLYVLFLLYLIFLLLWYLSFYVGQYVLVLRERFYAVIYRMPDPALGTI